MAYWDFLTAETGIATWLIIIILVWSAVWKLIALWKSARNNHLVWFLVLAIVNMAGILEIIYIFGFSKMKLSETKKPKTTNKGSKKKVSKKKK